MNTILLQKILDILREGLAHVGDFFKDLFISDPQDGQVIAYDAESGHWVNKDATEVDLDLTNTFEAQAVATITDGAENIPMKSLVVDIVAKETGTGTKSPSNPYTISGWDEVVITQTVSNIDTTTTIALPSTVYGGDVDVVSGQGNITYGIFDLGDADWTYSDIYKYFYANNLRDVIVRTPNNKITSALSDCYSAVSRDTMQSDLTTDCLFSVNSAGLIQFRWLNYTDANQFKNAVTGQKLVYPLATPTPITTTPVYIKTQGGTENIYADTGDVAGEYYTKTAESVMALANITEDITSEITKNTTDFSDILFKASRNNKVVSIEIYSASTSAAVNDTFLSNLPKPAMNCKVLLVNTTLGEDGTILGTLKTTGELEIATSGAKSFSGLITYVAK